MDQDFHYYGTYYAARCGGFEKDSAALIAKAANFIDFFNETTYAAYWKLVSNTSKSSNYVIQAEMDCPRYTFQSGIFSTAVAPEDGLWCSYHFTPGNYDDPQNSPSREEVHGAELAKILPAFIKRDTNQGMEVLKKYPADKAARYMQDLKHGNLLNRPQSALSRKIIKDAILCATSDTRLAAILGYAAGGTYLLSQDRARLLQRFKLILLGVRAHVIADTWAHQDFCGISNVLNTYWDVNYNPASWNPANWGYGRQSIDYDDGTGSGWKNTVLSVSNKAGHPNLEAVPNGTSYLGHGWMGHLPDFSFLKYRYKPCWSNPSGAKIERDNPTEYKSAWLELLSLMTQANGKGYLKPGKDLDLVLQKAQQAIKAPCKLDGNTTGRKSSANAWQAQFNEASPIIIDVDKEPDSPAAVMEGMLETTQRPDRYGIDYVRIDSDLYLFQIAADYHFHFVKHYLETQNLYKFTGSWSKQTSALSPLVIDLF